ncbi:EamA family transporter [Natrarchaeobaculum sulfurireducens]|uniref:DMT superfamily transporter n=2 Tax=Natrarchaeobaculum sulfurireducens TaxID=2044521 RepID=A0A346PKE4_9EURY|nr:EamA family transporter [Natrarchaeobaculum sulfurireducens]AXR79989.1 DMT superfamily transporter [Natrarchaeobaculum sulfurireducens]
MAFSEIDSAVFFGSITMVTWGIWVVLGNAASESIDPRTAAAISYLVATPFALGYILVSDASLAITAKGGLLAGIAGLFTGIGLISMYIGLSGGSTTVVSTLGAMYFVVAALIGMVLLGDDVTITRSAGIIFAVIGVILVSQ